MELDRFPSSCVRLRVEMRLCCFFAYHLTQDDADDAEPDKNADLIANQQKLLDSVKKMIAEVSVLRRGERYQNLQKRHASDQRKCVNDITTYLAQGVPNTTYGLCRQT
eukprot:6483084-Amphidinium_carterae.1